MKEWSALLAVVFAAAACSPAPTLAPSSRPAATQSTLPSSTPPTTPTVVPTEAAVELPDPGGTCDAAQLRFVGPTIFSWTFAAMGTRHAVIFQQLANAGHACELAQPKVIGLDPAVGPTVPIAVTNLGHTVCKNNECHDVYPSSTAVPAGASVYITINAWFWIERLDPALPSPRPCGPAIPNVTGAVVPFAVGRAAMGWTEALKELCTDPPSFSLGITLATDLRGRLVDNVPPPCRTSQITLTPGASGVAAGTAYLQVEARNTSGADCLLAREPAVSITLDGAVQLTSGGGTDAASIVIAAHETDTYYLAWNMPCVPLPTGARLAHVELSAGQIVDMPLGDFGPSCVDGSTGVVFMETESP